MVNFFYQYIFNDLVDEWSVQIIKVKLIIHIKNLKYISLINIGIIKNYVVKYIINTPMDFIIRC